MTDATTHAASGPQGKTFFGHPRGLATLFFTELWERFSYYGMRGILVLFMVAAIQTGGLGMTTGKAAAIYGLYTAGVYLMALPGGWVADRLIGARNGVFAGGILIAAGNFCLVISSLTTFYLGLILIVLGTGLLKPNVSATVGDLYPEGGARRDAGFSIFYMGINVGALIGPLVTGYLGEIINWHLGFLAAGIGMILGLIQYKVGGKYLGDAGVYKEEARETRPEALRVFMYALGGMLIVILLLAFLQRSGITSIGLEGAAQATGVLIMAIAVLYFASILVFGHLGGDEKKRVVLIFFLFLGAAMFWSGFEQAGSSMNLFAEGYTDRVVFGWEAPASWLQSVNPLFIILLAPVAAWLWVALGSRDPSIPAKFGIGLILLGIGFLVLAWGYSFYSEGSPVSPMWLVVTYFLHTSGELALSPVGLSSVTKLAPKRLVGQMMGIWFMGSSLGNLIAGLAAGQLETLEPDQLFRSVAMMVMGAGLLFLIFKNPIKKLTVGVR